jgi:N-acetylglucosaminyldiphosphoundecaprenol N-acetyl-beta-D-mannosaminyltransferase
MRDPVVILGVPFDSVTTAEAITRIEGMIASGKPHYVITANVDFVVQAQSDIELRRIFFDAHLVLCDGTPLVWASRLLGNCLPERVAGADIVPMLLELSAQRGYRVFFLGATGESLQRATDNLKVKLPGLQVAGCYSPPFRKLLEMDHEEIRRRIQEAKPDLLFVALGCPKQEKWIAMHYRDLGVPIAMGVGATIDFLAGMVRRAPVWMQRSGVEWAFRLAQEPRRLARRYATDLLVFSHRILRQAWELHGTKGTTRSLVPKVANAQAVALPARLDFPALADGVLEKLAAVSGHCLMDASRVVFVDSTGMGFLVRLQRKLRTENSELVIIAPSPALNQALRLMKLTEFFNLVPDARTAELLIERRSRENSEIACANPAERLAWKGEITAANVELIWAATRIHIDELPKGESLVIHLTLVRFIDSSGLGLMVRVKRHAVGQGKEVCFKNPQPAVRNVMRLAKLEQFLITEAGPAGFPLPGRSLLRKDQGSGEIKVAS